MEHHNGLVVDNMAGYDSDLEMEDRLAAGRDYDKKVDDVFDDDLNVDS